MALWGFGIVAAEDNPALRGQVETLIQGLDGATLAERGHAERELLELGPAVLPLLPPPESVQSPSVREAMRRIRPKLERQAARDSSAPFPISLRAELAVHEIIEELQRQSRNRLTVSDDLAPIRAHRLAIDWDTAHFWSCLDELCQRESIQWRFSKEAPEILLSAGPASASSELAVQRSGPFRLTLLNLEQRPIIGDDQRKIIRATGRISVEPRLRPLFLSMAVEDIRAVVNDEFPLPAWNQGARYEFPVGDGQHEIPVQWDFACPFNIEARTLSIRGRMTCQIAAATERIVFDESSQKRGTTRRRGGVIVRLRTVNLENVSNGPGEADIGLTVSYDQGGPAFESHRSWIFHNAVYLESKAGRRSPYSNFEITQQADGAVAVDYHWRNVAELGHHDLFVYEAPTLIVDVPIDVDLPRIVVAAPRGETGKVETQSEAPPRKKND